METETTVAIPKIETIEYKLNLNSEYIERGKKEYLDIFAVFLFEDGGFVEIGSSPEKNEKALKKLVIPDPRNEVDSIHATLVMKKRGKEERFFLYDGFIDWKNRENVPSKHGLSVKSGFHDYKKLPGEEHGYIEIFPNLSMIRIGLLNICFSSSRK